MNAKQTILTSLATLAACAAIGCGSSPHAAYPSSGKSAEGPADYDGAQAPQPGYGQPDAPAPMSDDAGLAGEQQARKSAPSSADPFEISRPTTRPGLATQWGERRHSRVTTAPFVRAERSNPFALGKLFYNDPDGIAAMSDTLGAGRRHTRRFSIGAGYVEMGVRDGSGRFLTGFVAGGNNYVTGISGHRYTIVVKNHSPGRIEAVVTVDGLDVIDGKSGSLAKRGYLIDPYGDLEIDGFRTSTSEVAAFRFGSVSKSYAAKKHGDTRNVGVIGLALFHERGDSPRHWGTPRSHEDVNKRHGADPFPKRYATPPN